MMPITWHRIQTRDGYHEIPEYWCEECGVPASFGHGASMKSAKSKTDPALGRWFCSDHNPDKAKGGGDE